ncbi:hypothetical protein Rumeso_03421 [Rubellimicrobium mesophilum DSM 19309]|uniref:Uncharacterized protein n=1 Tax=Rubellimicrobium mesophilum DSM 19309 TaxID=442562 RepID=A0A017HKJ1_9RHOB|nr:hypothetical protein Rumeso_03421 [Rubellimicrobium mesophilum DSM 19309]
MSRCGAKAAFVVLADQPKRPPGFGYAPPATAQITVLG